MGSVAQAQDGPGYEETLNFLHEKLNLQSSSDLQKLVQNKKCEFSIVIETLCCGVSVGNIETYTFKIKYFDPSKVKFYQDSVRDFYGETVIQTIKNKRVVNWSSRNPGYDPLSKRLSRAIFRLVRPPQSDNGPRVVRALKHLIRLCGGQEELF